MLIATDLGKRYGARIVFRGLSFEVDAGRAVAVVGRNGSGKSTLLKTVAGLQRPSVGKLNWQVGGEAIPAEELSPLCGLCAPDAPLYRELTCAENLRFWCEVRAERRDDADLREHLDRFELGGRWDDLAGELSSGLRARLQLAVATLHRPPILLLDEPGANFDDAGRDVLDRVLTEQRSYGIALVATNDAREAGLCDGEIEL